MSRFAMGVRPGEWRTLTRRCPFTGEMVTETVWTGDDSPGLPRNMPPYAVRFEPASVVVLDRGYRTLAEIDLTSPEVRGLLRAMLDDNDLHCHLDWYKRHGLQYSAQFGMLSALATIYPTKWHTRSEAFHRPEVQR